MSKSHARSHKTFIPTCSRAGPWYRLRCTFSRFHSSIHQTSFKSSFWPILFFHYFDSKLIIKLYSTRCIDSPMRITVVERLNASAYGPWTRETNIFMKHKVEKRKIDERQYNSKIIICLHLSFDTGYVSIHIYVFYMNDFASLLHLLRCENECWCEMRMFEKINKRKKMNLAVLLLLHHLLQAFQINVILRFEFTAFWSDNWQHRASKYDRSSLRRFSFYVWRVFSSLLCFFSSSSFFCFFVRSCLFRHSCVVIRVRAPYT